MSHSFELLKQYNIGEVVVIVPLLQVVFKVVSASLSVPLGKESINSTARGWLAPPSSVRISLGVPLGNDFSESDFWKCLLEYMKK